MSLQSQNEFDTTRHDADKQKDIHTDSHERTYSDTEMSANRQEASWTNMQAPRQSKICGIHEPCCIAGTAVHD